VVFCGIFARFSYGIWKSVSLVTVPSVAITHHVVHSFYQGEYPTSPLDDTSHGGFEVQVRVHLWAPTAGKGSLSVRGSWQADEPHPRVPANAKPIEIQWLPGTSNVTVTMHVSSSDAVQLWWPAGSGFPTEHGGELVVSLVLHAGMSCPSHNQLPLV
jgi:hypothetical protein